MSVWRMHASPTNSGPTIAATTRMPITMSDHRAVGCAKSRRTNERSLEAELLEAELLTDARVDRQMQQIGEEVADDDEHRSHDHGRGDQIVVVGRDGARGDESHAGPVEDLFDEQ